MESRLLVRALVCGAVLASFAATSRAPGAEPESRYFCTQVGEFFNAGIEAIAPAVDGGVYAAGVAYEPISLGDVVVPATDGRIDIYLVRIAPGGAVERASYIETRRRPDGTWADAHVRAMAIARDGAVWVAGRGAVAPVGLPDLGGPVDGGYADAWIAKFAPDGALAFATNLGGSGDEQVNGLALTPDGDAVVVGTTQSPDFPALGAFQTVHGGGRDDGFVALVRGDGSGLAWSSFLGGEHHDDANAVAVTAGGEILVASRSRDSHDWDEFSSVYESDDVRSLYAADLVHLSADGAVISVTPLPLEGDGGVFALAVEPDGRILAGGAASPAGDPSTSEARLMRLSADGATLEGQWSAEGVVVRQLARAPDGGIFVGTSFMGNTWEHVASGCRLVAPGLDDAAPPIDVRKFGGNGGYVHQLVMAPDGALCLFAVGPGLPFGDAPLSTDGYTMFVSRIPLVGADPPSRIRVVAKGRRWAEIAWTGDGDAFASYQVETSTGPVLSFPTYAPAAVRPGDARSVRLTGLRPGQYQFVRVIAVLPSGVKVLVPEAEKFRTDPDVVTDVRAHQLTYGSVVVSIRSQNGEGTVYEVERKSGAGPWIRMRRVYGDAYDLPRTWDDPRSWTGELRVYRARAVAGGVRTDWVESNELRMR